MDIELDLATANREALLAVIAELMAANGQLQQRVAALESRLNNRGSSGMPGNKSPSGGQAPRKETRERRPHGFARVRMAPTHRMEHALEVCPECGTGLVGGWVQRTREVIDPDSIGAVVPVQGRLCRRIERFIKELFVFVADPAVPPDNPDAIGAERSLRHLVISRKISGGTRSDQGIETKSVLTSLFGTWRLQGRDPYQAVRQVLTAPQSAPV